MNQMLKLRSWLLGLVVLVVACFVVLSSPERGYADSAQGRAGAGVGENEYYVNIEEAMREFNARYMYFKATDNNGTSGIQADEIARADYYRWPNCRGCGCDESVAPAKPEDGTYKSSMWSEHRAAAIVAAVVDAFYGQSLGTAPNNEALFEKFVKVEGATGNSFSSYTASDFPKSWEAVANEGVTTKNYKKAAAKITAYIKELKSLGTALSPGPSLVGVPGKNHPENKYVSTPYGPASSNFAYSTAEEALEACAAAWDDPQSEPDLSVHDWSDSSNGAKPGSLVGNIFPGGVYAEFASVRGRYHFTGTAGHDYVMYMRVVGHVEGDDTRMDPSPPVPPHATYNNDPLRWYSYMTFSGGGDHYTPVLGGEKPNWKALDFSDVYGGFIWHVDSVQVHVVPSFDASPDGNCQTACSGPCAANQGSDYTVGSMQARFGLGMLDDNTMAGYMRIHAQKPGATLFTPDMLQIVTGSSVEVIRESDRTPRQVKTDHLLIDIVTINATKYEIRYYHDHQVSATKSGTPAVYTLTGDPYRTIVVSRESNDNNIRFTEKDDGGDVTLVNQFVWDGTDTWDLYEGLDKTTPMLSSATKRRSKGIDIDGSTRTETIKSMEADGTVLSEIEEVYTQYPFGWVLTKRTVDPGNLKLTETYTYYTTPAEDGYGKVKTHTSEAGYWEHYVYDSDHVLTKTIRQRGENLYDGSNLTTLESNNVVELLETFSCSKTINGAAEDLLVSKVTTKNQGNVEQVSYTIYRGKSDVANGNLNEVWSLRSASASPESGYADTLTFIAAYMNDLLADGDIDDADDAKHMLSRAWAYKGGFVYDAITDESHDAYADPFDTARRISPDGQAIFYDYTADRTSVVSRGFMANPLATTPAVDYGSRTTTVTDEQGNLISTKVEKISESDNGGDWFLTSFTKTSDTDDFGRPTETEYFFGVEAANELASSGTGTAAYSTSIDDGASCCGSQEMIKRIGRDGVEHRTYPDDLGRSAKTIRAYGTSGQITSLSFYDGAGRVTSRGIDANDDGDLDDADDRKTVTTYDAAGRVTSVTAADGRKNYTTYRRVKADGTAFTVGTDTGHFYWETRSYGHDDDVPVSVTWTNSQGSTVLSYTGSGTWTGTPTGTEPLTEHTRSTSVYDWNNRMIEGRAYFNIGLLAKDAEGTAGTHYLVTGKTAYDVLGRAYQQTDSSGNITRTVYEDGTGRLIKTQVGVDVADLHTVSRVYYNKFVSGNPTGDARPWPTRVYTVKPGLTSAPDDSDLDDSTPTFTDYTYTETLEFHDVNGPGDYLIASQSRSRPEHGPMSRHQLDVEGRSFWTSTYQKGDWGHVLSQSVNDYDTSGRLYRTRVKPTDGAGSIVHHSLLTSQTSFDDASRPVKTETKGRGFTKTEYDAYGRTKRTVFVSEEGSNTSTHGPNAFTDDIVLTETVPTYDKSGRVIKTVTYERAHDATATGLLSAAAANQSRVSTSMTWYDANGRPTHQVAFGTNTPSTSYDDPLTDTAPEPNTSDDYLVSKVEYDAAGRAHVRIDNLGRKTKTFYDDLGRVTHTVENWDGGELTTPDSPGYRNADINRITKNVYDNSATGGGARIQLVAIDPDADGNTSDNQVTHYIHSGEVNASERGPIPVNGRPIAVLMPDAIEDGTTRANAITEINAGGEVFGDFTFTSYYTNGQVKQTTDQRGVQRNNFYTPEGWLDYTTVTEATGNTWDSTGDLRTEYTYGDAGEVLTITTFDLATGGSPNETSKISYTYDGFYNRQNEKQDHDPTANSGAGNPKTVAWDYDTTLSGSIYTNAYRLKSVTYPNSRKIHTTYNGHNGIDDAISRANAISNDYVTLVEYSYLGSGRMVIKDLPQASIKLDYFAATGQTGTYDGFDAFGRIKAQRWHTYGDDLLHIQHGYDRNANKLYDDRKVDTGFSKVFGHDQLNRVTTAEQGILVDNAGTKEINWKRLSEETHLDQLGNPTQIDRETKTPYTKNITHNDANELKTREVYERARSARVIDYFIDPSTASDWDIPGSDTFTITGWHLQPTSVTADSINGTTESAPHGLFLWGPKLGPVANQTYLTFDPSITTPTRAGFVFGYQDAHNYWIVVLKYVPGGQSKNEICQVVDGTLTVVASRNVNVTAGQETQTHIGSTKKSIQNGGLLYVFPNGYPAGRVGIYTDSTLVKFNKIDVYPHDEPSDLAGRWDRHSSSYSGTDGIAVINTDIRRHYPTFLRGVTLSGDKPWRTTVMLNRSNASRNADIVRFIFNATEIDTYSTIDLNHASIALNPSGHEFVDGEQISSKGTSIPANVVTATNQNDKLWCRVAYDGTTVSLKMKVDNTGPPSEANWASTNPAYTATDFNMTGGKIGFRAAYGTVYIKHVKVETDANDDGTFVTEYEDDIAAWAEYEPITHEHDAAGNLTFDGEKQYTYDAYNRLVQARNAYRDASNTIQVGSPLADYAYDAGSRRIRKSSYLGGVLDNVEHFYYHNQSLIETRNGSDQVTQQHVWGNLVGQYIDSLVEVANNTNPSVDNTTDYTYHPLYDTQFNVLALVDSTGWLVERYEYSLYGQRKIYNRALAPRGKSAHNINIGFQGLMHDTETGLVYNRSRMLNPRLKRFNQPDIQGGLYPDGLNTYAAYHVMRGGVDPSGRALIEVAWDEKTEEPDFTSIPGETSVNGGIAPISLITAGRHLSNGSRPLGISATQLYDMAFEFEISVEKCANLSGDAKLIIRGSSVTGISFRSGIARTADTISDYDLAIVDDLLLSSAHDAGAAFYGKGTRTNVLAEHVVDALDLNDLDSAMNDILAKPSSFVVYDSIDTVVGRPDPAFFEVPSANNVKWGSRLSKFGKGAGVVGVGWDVYEISQSDDKVRTIVVKGSGWGGAAVGAKASAPFYAGGPWIGIPATVILTTAGAIGGESAMEAILDSGDSSSNTSVLRPGSGDGFNYCFKAGTLVKTEFGYNPIEKITEGTMVWSFDHKTGKWILCRVLDLKENEHHGEMVELSVKGESLHATGTHPFWVSKGKDLKSRPEVVIPHAAQQKKSVLTGRWVSGRDLEKGDVLVTVDGNSVLVENVRLYQDQTNVYNISVEQTKNYCVLKLGILVHNK